MTLPSIPETKTTEPTDEEMPQNYGSASRTSTSEIQEAQDGFTGPTAHLELGTPWTSETLFKIHPSQTRGRYDGHRQRTTVHWNRQERPYNLDHYQVQRNPLRERELHNLTHLPYRRWLPACVAAKAKASPHYQRNESSSATRSSVQKEREENLRGSRQSSHSLMFAVS